MFIETESTPNPATLKFLPGREVLAGRTADFADADAALISPLANHLFGLPGVERVFLGADFITVHAEAGPHLDRSLQRVRDLGCKAGATLCPATSEQVLEHVLDRLDLILVMTVNPGFGGQAFIASQLEKIRRIRAMIGPRPIRLEVDGGINRETAALVAAAGADTIVAGSTVFKDGPIAYSANIAALRAAAQARISSQ